MKLTKCTKAEFDEFIAEGKKQIIRVPVFSEQTDYLMNGQLVAREITENNVVKYFAIA